MAAQPKKKTSKVRSKTRRAHQAKTLPTLIKLGETRIPHRLVSYHKRYATAAATAKATAKLSSGKPAAPKRAAAPKKSASKAKSSTKRTKSKDSE